MLKTPYRKNRPDNLLEKMPCFWYHICIRGGRHWREFRAENRSYAVFNLCVLVIVLRLSGYVAACGAFE